MKLEDVLPAFRAGKKIKRTTWVYPLHIQECLRIDMSLDNIIADDWEIVEECQHKNTATVNQKYFCCDCSIRLNPYTEKPLYDPDVIDAMRYSLAKPKEVIQDVSELELAGMNIEQVLELKRFYQMHHAELPNRNKPLPAKTKTVWQWARWNPHVNAFCAFDNLLTEEEAKDTFTTRNFKISEPIIFEVSNE